MTYKTVNQSTLDTALYGRVQACVVEQQLSNGVPINTTPTNEAMWAVCSADDVEAAYASALAANNPDPGGDESVVTDGMILSAVQAHLAP